jgi:small-conductance mechanosensitive channel
MAATVAKARARARPWRAILSLLVAVAAAVVAARSGHLNDQASATAQAIKYGCAAAFFIFGLAAAFGLSGQARASLQPVIGQAHAGVIRYAVVLASLFVLLVVTLDLVGVSPRQLLVGGAVTGVLLGIAAQQSLSNLFAGLVMLFARPFRVGDQVRFRAGALSGQIEGIVTDISLTYVRLQTEDGRVLVPNSQALAAAVMLVRPPGDAGDTGLTASLQAGQGPQPGSSGPAPSGAGPLPELRSASDSPHTSL